MSAPQPRVQSSFSGFSTGVLLASVGFILGVLFTSLITEQALLYSGRSTTKEAYRRAEFYYLVLWNSPLVFKALFHSLLVTPIFTLCVRVATYSQAALYFDGISLLLSVLVMGLYTGSTIPNIRKLAASPPSQELVHFLGYDGMSQFDSVSSDPSCLAGIINRILSFLSSPTTWIMKADKLKEAEEIFHKSLQSEPVTDQVRKELLSVTAAGHSIAIFLLIGILVLQAGKVYAEHEEAKLLAQFKLDQQKHQPEPETKKTQ